MTSPTVRQIQRAVCERFGLSRADLISPAQARRLSHPRQIGYYLAREMTPLSMNLIGRHFGGRDPTTVLHGVRTIGRLRCDRGSVYHAVNQVRRRVFELVEGDAEKHEARDCAAPMPGWI